MPILDQLTAREQEILALVANGYENKAIACQLQISVFTVQTHIRNLFERLGVQNRTQAARLCWQHLPQSQMVQNT